MDIDRRLVARYFTREILGVVVLLVALFWSAGELAWWPGWALALVTLGWAIATGIVILRTHPPLLAERLGPRRGAKRWDVLILGLYGVEQIAVLIVAGLDHRLGWSQGFSSAVQVAGLVLTILGYTLVVWATGANAYFSQVVRIQEERGHAVVTGGPYRYVRHPGYLGTLLTSLAAPVLLDSLWAVGAGAVGAALIVLRTRLEDRTLRAELPGYEAYAAKVQARLVPALW